MAERVGCGTPCLLGSLGAHPTRKLVRFSLLKCPSIPNSKKLKYVVPVGKCKLQTICLHKHLYKCGHFGWLKISFDRISRYFGSMCNFYIFRKMTPSGHSLDDPKSLSIAFLAISDQLLFFYKITPGGHFRWPKITLDRISDQCATSIFKNKS